MSLGSDHFTDDRMDAIRDGVALMTDEERTYLLETLPSFEECDQTAEQLAQMDGPELMNAAYFIWRDYVR